jgi:hypothetical protein
MKNIILLILLIPINLYSQGKLSISGTYRFGKDINKENVGEILVVEKSDNQAIIYITTSLKAPSYKTFSLLTEVSLIDNKAYYQTSSDSGKLGFVFSNNKIKIIDNSAIMASYFPINNIEFNKISAKIPEYFIRGDGSKIVLKKTVDDFEINYYHNKKLWDFIGIWNFDQNKESLNISKNMSNEEIKIQYNSWTDGYEDRFFDNCKFINGKIIGDYYGAKNNVILEIEDGNLLLTINPYHEFTPVVKQLFKKSGNLIFKYNSSNNNEFLTTQPNATAIKIDSVPPGDRILIHDQNNDESFFKIKFYVKRYHKNLIDNKHLFVSGDKLRNTKPLLLFKNVQLKGFINPNLSELFIQRLYSSEKLKRNLVIVPLSGYEQNYPGQQKLLVDEEAFLKLNLHLIGKKYLDNNLKIYITGSVDLYKDFYSLVIDYQYNDEFYTYLVNYNLKEEYIDHMLIGRNDYVESMNRLVSNFTSGEIYTNKQIQIFEEEESAIGSGYYQTYEQERYIINQAGQFIASNHANFFMHETGQSIEIVKEKVKSKKYGSSLLSLFLNYNNTNEYLTTMFTKLNSETGHELIIPIDLSAVKGFYYPPYGDFISFADGELEKLFYINNSDGVSSLMPGIQTMMGMKN